MIKFFIQFIIILLFSFGFSAQDVQVNLKITGKLKIQPDSKSKTIAWIAPGREITVLNGGEKYGDYQGFYAVRYNGQSGYLNDVYFDEKLKKHIKSFTIHQNSLNENDLKNALPPILTIYSIEFSKNTLVAAETARLSITLKNTGPGDASNVFITLSCNLPGITFPSNTNFSLIKAGGGEQTVSIDIKGGLDLPTAEAIMQIEITEPNFKIKIQGKQLRFPTRAFQKPELILAQYAVLENQFANPNNQININEMIDLKFAVQNVGQGEAGDVQIEVQNVQDGVLFLGIVEGPGMKRTNPVFTKIEAGKYETVIYKYFINSEFSADKLEFTINAKEKHGQFGFSEKKSFPVNRQLEEAGYIRTVAANQEQTPKKFVIEEIPDFVVDVDFDIPETVVSQENTYALIIGNEDYHSKQRGLTAEQNVDYAANDAVVFSQYCIKTLGIPSNQVRLLQDATAAEMNQSIAWLANLAQIENGKAKLIFYYSGHGLPHEQTKEAYLVPVDVSGTSLEYAVGVKDIYSRLTEHPAQQVTVFLDACFSGGARNEGLLAMRGVRIKPKENMITGNLVVLSSSTGEESSASYTEMQHGFFTYFLLKKLKETKGDTTLEELSEYMKQSVTKASALEGKIQTPQVKVSAQIQNTWGSLKLK